MSIQVAIRHQMHYDYDRYIEVSPQIIRLKPAAHSRTRVEAYSLKFILKIISSTGTRIHSAIM